jgi:hypothetical protein
LRERFYIAVSGRGNVVYFLVVESGQVDRCSGERIEEVEPND